MTGESKFPKQSSRIVVAGSEKVIAREYEVESGTNMYPGRLATAGSTNDEVAVCGASDDPTGWIGYEDTADVYRKNSIKTVYETGDRVSILTGIGFVIWSKASSGTTYVRGAHLKVAASGVLQNAVVGTDQVVAVVADDTTNSGATGDIWIPVVSLL